MLIMLYRSYGYLAEFNPVSGKIEKRFTRNSSDDMNKMSVFGMYDTLDGERSGGDLAVLFRLDDVLYLDVKSGRYSFRDCRVDLVDFADSRRLCLYDSDNQLAYETTYLEPIIDPPLEFDFTPFVEEEHFDFGQFLRNLSNDVARQHRLFTATTE